LTQVKLTAEVSGRIDLDGTHRGLLECAPDTYNVTRRAFDAAHKQGVCFAVVRAHGRACGFVINDVRTGTRTHLNIDRYKLRCLGVESSERVSVDFTAPVKARKVQLSVPADFSDKERTGMQGKPVVEGEETAFFTFTGEPRPVVVVRTEPKGICVITSETEVVTKPEAVVQTPLGYHDIGGLAREIARIREIVEYPLRFPQVLKRMGITPPRGIILHGPPGTGKTLIAKALASQIKANFYCVSGPELFTSMYGKTEENVRGIFDEAESHAPAIVVIDELDSLVPRRESAHGDLEQRVVATFLAQMDGLKQKKGPVVVIGTTNRIDAIDTALRRGGRFEHEIHVGVPDPSGRREILLIHARGMPLSPEVDLASVAERAAGYVGADLAALCREAAYNALRRVMPVAGMEDLTEVPTDTQVTQGDFDQALATVSPSAMREFLIEVPRVTWDDVGGLDDVKRLLVENITYATTRREAFEAADVKPAKGILLYGPPGTGKTMLAKAAAAECGANFIFVKGPEIRSKWYGESEHRVRFIFSKARQNAPCVIFFDEIDAVAATRSEGLGSYGDRADATIVNQILSEIDGAESADGVFIIGATNRPDMLDPAVLRPGRFDYQVEVPLPDAAARKAILNVHLKRKPLADDVRLARLVVDTEGFSGAEIAEVCREAAFSALRDNNFAPRGLTVKMAHLEAAVARVQEGAKKLKPKRIGFGPDQKEKP
jgi:transitional endoplasmic reticulum ATPase